VVGFGVTSSNRVRLLFWNRQSLGEPELDPAGKFNTAQVHFEDVSEIDPRRLRGWLKKPGKEIWDLARVRKRGQGASERRRQAPQRRRAETKRFARPG
jgi:hypothetical protein